MIGRALCTVTVVLASASPAVSPRVGLDNVLRFDELPYPHPGVLVRQHGSFDPAGNNDDGFACNRWAYHDGEYVLLDEVGPGCIESIWCTSPPTGGRIRIYFDNEAAPRVDRDILAFFSGTAVPFLAPLVGNDHVSSSGFYCKVPLVFAHRVRVAFTAPPCFWNILWRRYPPDMAVTSFTPALDVSAAVAMYNAAGADPKPTAGNQTLAGTAQPAAGQIATLVASQGAGYIAALKIDPQPATEAVLSNLWLRITFDDAARPHVNAPVGLFFGCGAGETNVRGLPLGMAVNGWYYCYFPMPYWRSVRIELANHSAVAVTVPYEVHVNGTPYQQEAGYFCAKYRRENPTGGDDYLFLDVAGSGQFLGASMVFVGPSDYSYLEGDERFYIDGSLTPQIHGTGTEDYLLAGWYFGKGPFTLPTHGMVWQDTVGASRRLAMYRFHLNDRIPFSQRLVAGIEHGPVNDVAADYASVAYYYCKPAIAAFAADRLDIGDSADESAHAYSVQGQVWTGSLASAYLADAAPLTDSGRQFNGHCQFTLALPPVNRGAVLRRRLNHAAGRQQGLLSLDGAPLVRWETNNQNSSRRWKDSEVCLPAARTAGRNNITVRIDAANWTEFRYELNALAACAAPLRWEVERLAPAASSGRDLLRLRGDTPWWDWGGDLHVEYQATGAGDWIAYDVPVPAPGWYGVWPTLSRRAGSGLVQVSIDGAPTGSPVNLHAGDYRQGPLPGPGRLVELTGPTCRVRFDVVGKAAASPGYLAGIDAIQLAPVVVGNSPSATPPPPTPTDTPTIAGPAGTPLGVFNGGFEGGAVADPDNERQRPDGWGCGTAATGSWQGVAAPPRPPKHKVEQNWNQRSGQRCFNMRDLAGPGHAYIIYSSAIAVQPGALVTAGAWFLNYKDIGNPANCACAVGIHPGGGTDAAGVVWGVASTAENVYTRVQAEAVAAAGSVRVFLRVNTQAAFVDAVLWDDVEAFWRPHTPPTPTATPTPQRPPSVEVR